jgi:hypothetical protein
MNYDAKFDKYITKAAQHLFNLRMDLMDCCEIASRAGAYEVTEELCAALNKLAAVREIVDNQKKQALNKSLEELEQLLKETEKA